MCLTHRVHTEWKWPLSQRTFHHDGKISPAWRWWGVHAHALALYLPSLTKFLPVVYLCLAVCFAICLSILSFSPSVCPSSLDHSICLNTHTVCLFVVFLSVLLPVCLSSVCESICLVCMPVWLSVCQVRVIITRFPNKVTNLTKINGDL